MDVMGWGPFGLDQAGWRLVRITHGFRALMRRVERWGRGTQSDALGWYSVSRWDTERGR